MMSTILAACLVFSANIAFVTSFSNVTRCSVIGERVEMKCSVNEGDSVSWTYTAWNSSNVTNIYLGIDVIESLKSRYMINNIRGQLNLIIASVDFNHAGGYKCTTTQHAAETYTQLTVLASPPNCSSNISNADERIKEHGFLWLVCLIVYRPAGNMTPIFAWTKDNTKNVIVANITTDSDSRTVTFTTTSSVLVQVRYDDNCATFKCKITFQFPNDSRLDAPDYEYTWNYTTNVTYASYDKNYNYSFKCTANNTLGAENKTITVSDLGKHFEALPAALAIGGSLLLLLVITIIVSCVVHRKRQKAVTSHRPDLTSCGSDGADAVYSEVRKPKESDGRIDGASAVYSEVRNKPKGPSKGINKGKIGDNSRRSPQTQTQNRERENDTGADGTVYAELSGVKPPARKAEVPKPPPGYSQVEIYASIDHSAEVPAPPCPPRK